MICDEKDFHKTLKELETTFLDGYRQTEITSKNQFFRFLTSLPLTIKLTSHNAATTLQN